MLPLVHPHRKTPSDDTSSIEPTPQLVEETTERPFDASALSFTRILVLPDLNEPRPDKPLMHSRKCQTMTASPAKPGLLPL